MRLLSPKSNLFGSWAVASRLDKLDSLRVMARDDARNEKRESRLSFFWMKQPEKRFHKNSNLNRTSEPAGFHTCKLSFGTQITSQNWRILVSIVEKKS